MKSRKPYPGLGAYVLLLNYSGTWVAAQGAQTLEGAQKIRRKYPQWRDADVAIVPNVAPEPLAR